MNAAILAVAAKLLDWLPGGFRKHATAGSCEFAPGPSATAVGAGAVSSAIPTRRITRLEGRRIMRTLRFPISLVSNTTHGAFSCVAASALAALANGAFIRWQG